MEGISTLDVLKEMNLKGKSCHYSNCIIVNGRHPSLDCPSEFWKCDKVGIWCSYICNKTNTRLTIPDFTMEVNINLVVSNDAQDT